MAKASNEKIQIWAVFTFIILGVALFVWLTTYNPKGHYNAGGGSVEIESRFAGSRIVVDGVTEYTTKKDNEVHAISRLAEKKYQFAVAREGYWPWAKDFTPKPETKKSFKSFSIRTNPQITQHAPESEIGLEWQPKFNSLKAPSEKNKLISSDGKVAVWSEFANIFAEWLGEELEAPDYLCPGEKCGERIIVVKSQSNIRSLSFLEDHNDVVLFADDQGIYAIELDKTGIQNFQPIYRAPVPQFILKEPRVMMAESRGDIFEISF